jgi:transcriptional regulator with XRE-family HTH domain
MADFFEYVRTAAREAGFDIDSPRGGGKKALAEQVDMSSASVGRMLAGQTIPEASRLPVLADVLGLSRDRLLNLAGIATDEKPEIAQCTNVAASDAKDRFAEWLRKARVAVGLSQRAVAEAVAPQGFHWTQSKIAKIEGGELIPRLDEAVALVNVFDTTLDVALGMAPGSPDSLASRQAASQTVLLQQIRASIDAELGGAQ